MPEFDIDGIGRQIGSYIKTRVAGFVDEQFARVNTRAGHHGRNRAEGGMERVRDYDATPGSIAQSHAPWLKGVRDALIDDRRAVRCSPGDATARLRLAISTALYAAAGDAFADIVVSADALSAEDPLARPAFEEARRSRSKALRAEHLAPAQEDAVLGAASDDRARVAAARAALERMIAEGSDAEAQVAAALLGQIGDPMNRSKINRLANAIEKRRWEADGATPAPETSARPARRRAAAAPSVTAGIVSPDGELARRAAFPPAERPLGPATGPANASDFYDEEEL